MTKQDDDGNLSCRCSCVGCLGFIAAVVLLWGLLFGVTFAGEHHGISCSRARGVEIK